MAEGGFRVTTSLVRRTSTGAGGGVASIGRPAIIDPRTGKTVSSPSRVVKTEVSVLYVFLFCFPHLLRPLFGVSAGVRCALVLVHFECSARPLWCV